MGAYQRLHRNAFTRGATTRLTADEFALLAEHEIAHW